MNTIAADAPTSALHALHEFLRVRKEESLDGLPADHPKVIARRELEARALAEVVAQVSK